LLGHALGGVGAIEAIFCLLAMRDGVIPPTWNYSEADPACDLDYVANVARTPAGGVPVVLSNSLGFGGHNVALVVRRV
jgi:3-oxoacyl-[acyl-carrier-protein] synthase II